MERKGGELRMLFAVHNTGVSLTSVRLTRGLEFLLRGLWFRYEVVKQKCFGDLQMPTIRTVWL